MTVKLEEYEAKTFVTDALCECGGKLIGIEDSSFLGLSNGGKFKHTCSKCGVFTYLDEKYPKVEYREEVKRETENNNNATYKPLTENVNGEIKLLCKNCNKNYMCDMLDCNMVLRKRLNELEIEKLKNS